MHLSELSVSRENTLEIPENNHVGLYFVYNTICHDHFLDSKSKMPPKKGEKSNNFPTSPKENHFLCSIYDDGYPAWRLYTFYLALCHWGQANTHMFIRPMRSSGKGGKGPTLNYKVVLLPSCTDLAWGLVPVLSCWISGISWLPPEKHAQLHRNQTCNLPTGGIKHSMCSCVFCSHFSGMFRCSVFILSRWMWPTGLNGGA